MRYRVIAVVATALSFASYVVGSATADDNMTDAARRANDIAFRSFIVFLATTIVALLFAVSSRPGRRH
jgi:hypothetical protein